MSKFKLKILSNYSEKDAICYFSEANLYEYLENLDEKYDEYDIQRGIVNNHFLEKLANTLKNKEFIPAIILVSNKNIEVNNSREFFIEKGKFKILDGLQRTMRLKKLLEATKFIEKFRADIKDLSSIKLRKFFREENKKLGFKTEADYIIKAIKNNLSIEDFNRVQWFEIWNNLDREQQIHKMILFNAGHKSMDIKHQLELIFLNAIELEKYDKCDYDNEIKRCEKEEVCLIHSKNISTRSFYNKKRKNDIHFTLLIDAIIALEYKKPFKIDQKSILNFQESYEEYEIIQKIVSKHIEKLIELFSFLDNLFCRYYDEKGLELLGRESVIIGLFAAIGNYISINDFDSSIEDIKNKLSNNIKFFDLNEFEQMKRNVDVTSFNIGDIMKETVYYLTLQILKGKELHFSNFPVDNSLKYRVFIEGLKDDK